MKTSTVLIGKILQMCHVSNKGNSIKREFVLCWLVVIQWQHLFLISLVGPVHVLSVETSCGLQMMHKAGFFQFNLIPGDFEGKSTHRPLRDTTRNVFVCSFSELKLLQTIGIPLLAICS